MGKCVPHVCPDESTCSSEIMAMGLGRRGGDSRRQSNNRASKRTIVNTRPFVAIYVYSGCPRCLGLDIEGRVVSRCIYPSDISWSHSISEPVPIPGFPSFQPQSMHTRGSRELVICSWLFVASIHEWWISCILCTLWLVRHEDEQEEFWWELRRNLPCR